MYTAYTLIHSGMISTGSLKPIFVISRHLQGLFKLLHYQIATLQLSTDERLKFMDNGQRRRAQQNDSEIVGSYLTTQHMEFEPTRRSPIIDGKSVILHSLHQ